MNELYIGVLVAVLCGVLVGGASGPHSRAVLSLVTALSPLLTFSPGSKISRPSSPPSRPPSLPPLARTPLSPRHSEGLPEPRFPGVLASSADGWSPVGDARRPRVRPDQVFLLSQTLTDRDWEILGTVNKLRLATGPQIERLHFHNLKEETRSRARRRVLKRLSDAHVIIALPRRIGGSQSGSEQQIYALDKAGAYLIEQGPEWRTPQRHTLSVPGALFYRHRLAVSELFVRLTEASRKNDIGIHITEFTTEPACWWRYEKNTGYKAGTVQRDYIKPDAFLSASRTGSEYFLQFWIEVDRGTESVSRVIDKIRRYATYSQDANSSEPPNGFMPRILITTSTPRRRDAIRDAIDRATWYLGNTQNQFSLRDAVAVYVECFDDATTAIIEQLPD